MFDWRFDSTEFRKFRRIIERYKEQFEGLKLLCRWDLEKDVARTFIQKVDHYRVSENLHTYG